MNTYMVQIITGDKFRDLYLTAISAEDAIAQAKLFATSYERRWAAFVA